MGHTSIVQGTEVNLPWLTLALAGSMVALFVALGPAPADLVYDRTAIADGQWWRLLTGHLVHSDMDHLAWNLGGLIVLGTLLERISRPALFGSLFAGIVGVNITLLHWQPDMAYYCGLSGALNALLVPVLTAVWITTRSPLIPAIALLSLAKIGVEASIGQAVFTHTTWASVPLAHLAGWVSGTLPCLLFSQHAAAYRRFCRVSPFDKHLFFLVTSLPKRQQ